MSTTSRRSSPRSAETNPIAACRAVSSLSCMLDDVSRRIARSSGSSPAAKIRQILLHAIFVNREVARGQAADELLLPVCDDHVQGDQTDGVLERRDLLSERPACSDRRHEHQQRSFHGHLTRRSPAPPIFRNRRGGLHVRCANAVPVDSADDESRSERSFGNGSSDCGGDWRRVGGAADDGIGAHAHLFRHDVLPLRLSGHLHRAVRLECEWRAGLRAAAPVARPSRLPAC